MRYSERDERSLCILQIFGPGGGNVGPTGDTVEFLKRAAVKLGMRAGPRIWLHGGSQALARSEVASLARVSSCTDFVWLDSDAWIEGQVREHALVLEQVLAVADETLQPVALPYVGRQAFGNAPHFACSFYGPAPVPIRLPGCGLRVAMLQGTGFGFVHMTRRHLVAMFTKYVDSERFASERPELAAVECVHVFRELIAPKAYDALVEPRGPPRALPEDDSFWHRAHAIGINAQCLVDCAELVHQGIKANLLDSYAHTQATAQGR